MESIQSGATSTSSSVRAMRAPRAAARPAFRANDSPCRGSLTARMRASSSDARRSAVPSVELLSTATISYAPAGAVCRSSASIADRSSAARLYVGRMTLTFGDIRPSPAVRRIEVAPDVLARFDHQQPSPVPPVDRRRARRVAHAGADRIDAGLQPDLVARELETA